MLKKKTLPKTAEKTKNVSVQTLSASVAPQPILKTSGIATPEQIKQYNASLKKMGYDDVVSQYSKKFSPPPIAEERAAITVYTGGSYGNMNRLLRGQPLDKDELKKYGNTETTLKQHIQMADKALRQLPAYEGTVYRSTTLPPDILAKYKPGR